MPAAIALATNDDAKGILLGSADCWYCGTRWLFIDGACCSGGRCLVYPAASVKASAGVVTAEIDKVGGQKPAAIALPATKASAADEAAEINKAGVTCIMVEQNARRCLQIADRGYVLDQGTDAVTGTGRELLNDPQVVGLYLGTLGT